MTSTAIDLLVAALDEAFERRSWHGTSLRGAPVSYTHLDVYKRQVQNGAQASARESTSDRRAATTTAKGCPRCAMRAVTFDPDTDRFSLREIAPPAPGLTMMQFSPRSSTAIIAEPVATPPSTRTSLVLSLIHI